VPFAFLIPAAASLIGGKMSSDAASDAAAQANAQNQRGLDLQREMFDEQKRLSEPYRQAGLTGQNRLMEMLGLGGDTGAAGYGRYAKDFSMQDYQQNPGYAFRLSEGLKQLGSQARAQGGAGGGRTMMGMQNYAQGLASQEYGNAFNRYQTNRQNQLAPLGSLMSSGQAAAVGQAGQAGQYGANASNMLSQMGVNTGGATLAGSSAYGKAIGDIGAQFGRNPPNFNNMFGSGSSQAGMYGGVPAEGFYY
jgi:hypothetical protein